MEKTVLLVIAMAFIFSVMMIGPAKAEIQKSEGKSAPVGKMMGEKHMMGKEMKKDEKAMSKRTAERKTKD